MSALDLIETQPKFPVVDLSDKNAEVTGLVLSNRQILRSNHVLAETVYPIFHGTHLALRIATNNILHEESHLRGIEFGIRAFEAVTLLVSADVPTVVTEDLEDNINNITDPENALGVANYFDDSHAKLQAESPNLIDVVHEAAGRYDVDPRMAGFGVAVARMFELQNVEHIEVK